MNGKTVPIGAIRSKGQSACRRCFARGGPHNILSVQVSSRYCVSINSFCLLVTPKIQFYVRARGGGACPPNPSPRKIKENRGKENHGNRITLNGVLSRTNSRWPSVSKTPKTRLAETKLAFAFEKSYSWSFPSGPRHKKSRRLQFPRTLRQL